MTTIKPVLNGRPCKDGRYTLIIQIIHRRKRGVIFTPHHILREEFDPQKKIVFALQKTRYNKDRVRGINEDFAARIRDLRSIVGQWENTGRQFTPKDITSSYHKRSDNRNVDTYVQNLCEELGQEGRHGTAGNYRSALSAFRKFAGTDQCRFDELTSIRLAEFEKHLKCIPVQRNTITFYMRVLRSVYNKALRAGLVNQKENPFENVSFRMDKTRKLAVGADVLKKVAEVDFCGQGHLAEARDLFMFSFYTRGMSFVDMAYLQRDAICDGVIHYKRRKTGQLFTVRIIPALKPIIDRYSHCTPWILPVMGGSCLSWGETDFQFSPHENPVRLHKRYKQALSRYLFHLGEVSEMLKTGKKLTFNVARHSWASLARTRGIPVSIISEGLGHTSEKTTEIYLDELDARELDRANELVTKL